MSEKITLTVFKDSPHIWAGGLEDQELALWLIAKGNMLLGLQERERERNEARTRFISYQARLHFIQEYANLGLSRKECDPIRPLCRELVRYDTERPYQQNSRSHILYWQATQADPYLLPEMSGLREELARYDQRKAHLSEQVASLCEQKADG